MMKRWLHHVQRARVGQVTPFYAAIRKHGPDAFDHEVLETVLGHEEADAAEQFWIAHLGSNDLAVGYNLDGGGTHRKTVSDSTRAKMRARWAEKTPEQKSEIARKREASIPPGVRRERAIRGNAKLTPEQRSERARRAHANIDIAAFGKKIREAHAKRTPEERSEAARRGNARRSPEWIAQHAQNMVRARLQKRAA